VPRTSRNLEFIAPTRSRDQISMKPTPNRIAGTHRRCDSAIAITTAVSSERIVYLIYGVFASLAQATCPLRVESHPSKDANPECATSFDDYRQGRLFRFYRRGFPFLSPLRPSLRRDRAIFEDLVCLGGSAFRSGSLIMNALRSRVSQAKTRMHGRN
jgi:hypothetical protein